MFLNFQQARILQEECGFSCGVYVYNSALRYLMIYKITFPYVFLPNINEAGCKISGEKLLPFPRGAWFLVEVFYTGLISRRELRPATFEQVLESLSVEDRSKLLFHLDLFV